VRWDHIQVGDILKVPVDEEFPADLFLLSSSDEDGVAMIETANLDGETNLKQRSFVYITVSLICQTSFGAN
jgi:P-type E1-E2 ATPase